MSKYYICLELGGTNLRLGIVDERLAVQNFEKLPTAGMSASEDPLQYLRKRLDNLIGKAGGIHSVKAITMSLASLMDRDRTILYSTPNVRNFDKIPIVRQLEEIYHVPVVIEKDANILLIYEMYRQGIDPEGIVAGIFAGTGLGNAICINGIPYIGHSGSACELGHYTVPGVSQMDKCGKQGCVELLASGRLLSEIARDIFRVEVGEIFTKYGGEPIIKKFIQNLAIAISTEVAILDPSWLILGGGIIGMTDFPIEELENEIRMNLRAPNPRESLRIRYASNDKEAGVIGAAIHARNKLQSKER